MKQYVKTFESFYSDYKKYNSLNEAESLEWNKIPVHLLYKTFKFENSKDFWDTIVKLNGKDFKLLTGSANPIQLLVNMLRFAGNESKEVKHSLTDSTINVYTNKNIPIIWKKFNGEDIYTKEIKDNEKVADYKISIGVDSTNSKDATATMSGTGGSGNINDFLKNAGNNLAPEVLTFKSIIDGSAVKNNLAFGYINSKDSILTQESKLSEMYATVTKKFANVDLADVMKKMNMNKTPDDLISSIVKSLSPETLTMIKNSENVKKYVGVNNTEKPAEKTKA